MKDGEGEESGKRKTEAHVHWLPSHYVQECTSYLCERSVGLPRQHCAPTHHETAKTNHSQLALDDGNTFFISHKMRVVPLNSKQDKFTSSAHTLL